MTLLSHRRRSELRRSSLKAIGIIVLSLFSLGSTVAVTWPHPSPSRRILLTAAPRELTSELTTTVPPPPPVVPQASRPPVRVRGSARSGGGCGRSLDQIGADESHNDYSAVNASSGAGGRYQILPSTWRSNGGQGLPQNASPAEQDRIAQKIYAEQGTRPWAASGC